MIDSWKFDERDVDMRVLCSILFAGYILLAFSIGYCTPISNQGAWNFYNQIKTLGLYNSISELSQDDNIYSFTTYNSNNYRFVVLLKVDDAGYVSEVAISTNYPQQAILNELANDEASGDYYDRCYKMLRNKGFASDVSERESHRRAEIYSNERIKKLDNLFYKYGVSGNNLINGKGMMLLSKMQEENIQRADSYFYYYLSPAAATRKGLNKYHVNKSLLIDVITDILPIMAQTNLSVTEITDLVKTLQNDSSSVYCSALRSTAYLTTKSDFDLTYVAMMFYAK